VADGGGGRSDLLDYSLGELPLDALWDEPDEEGDHGGESEGWNLAVVRYVEGRGIRRFKGPRGLTESYKDTDIGWCFSLEEPTESLPEDGGS
jgi:hypothetical protein